MDIKKMQKISELAKELVDKGVYDNLEEATKQAEVMVNKGDPGISAVLGTQSQEESNQENGQTKIYEELKLELRKLAFQVSEQAKSIAEFKSQLKNILDEINKLKLEKPKPILEKESGQEQTKISKEATEKKPHAKVGNYNPGDVSIEKFFYSGPPKE